MHKKPPIPHRRDMLADHLQDVAAIVARFADQSDFVVSFIPDNAAELTTAGRAFHREANWGFAIGHARRLWSGPSLRNQIPVRQIRVNTPST